MRLGCGVLCVCVCGWGGAALPFSWREVFNWRVTLGGRLVSSSPSITRGQEMPEVMLLLPYPPPTETHRQLCRAPPLTSPPPPRDLPSPGYLLPGDARPDASLCSRANEENGDTVHRFMERRENLTPRGHWRRAGGS